MQFTASICPSPDSEQDISLDSPNGKLFEHPSCALARPLTFIVVSPVQFKYRHVKIILSD